MGIIYNVLRSLVKAALKIYFKEIQVEGMENIPDQGPFLVTPNHQNAFLDAFLVGAFLPMPIFYLTRSDVFTWWSKPILHSVNMMPIYRIRDGFGNLSKNEAIFESSRKLFSEGKSMLMFAEGSHGEVSYLRPITKGAARLALTAQAELKHDLMIIPIGLNYFDPQRSNSKVIMAIGKSIPIKDYLSSYLESNPHGLTRLKEVIEAGMKSTLVIPEKTEDYEQRKKTIFQPKNERLSFTELRNLKVTTESIAEKPKSKHVFAKLLNPLPFLVAWHTVKSVDDVVFHSSLKFVIGLTFFPLWWSVTFFTIWSVFGIISSTIIVSMMIASVLISYKW